MCAYTELWIICPNKSGLSFGFRGTTKSVKQQSVWLIKTYIFKPVLAELHHEMKKDQCREPQTPHDNLLHCLYVQHAKDEYKLVEDEVPELVF